MKKLFYCLWICVCISGSAFAEFQSLTGSPRVQLTEFQYRMGDSPMDENGVPVWTYEGMDGAEWLDMEATDISSQQGRYEYLWIKTTLLEGEWIDPCLYIDFLYYLCEAYLGEEKLYAYGDFSSADRSFLPPRWHLISLPPDFAGRTIFLRVYSNAFHIGFDRLFIGSRSDHVALLFLDNFEYLAIGSFLFIVGILPIAAFLRWRQKEYLFFGLICLFRGCTIFYEPDVHLFIFDSTIVNWYFYMICFYLGDICTIVFFEILFSPICKHRIRYLRYAIILAAVMALISRTFSMIYFGYIDRAEILLVVITIIWMIGIILRSGWRKEKISKLSSGLLIASLLFWMKDYLSWGLAGFNITLPTYGLSSYTYQYSSLIFVLLVIWVLIDRLRNYAVLEESNRRLREIDQMKSQFVSQASHDLRTPLTAIKGSLDNLLMGIAGDLNDKQSRIMERATKSVDRLTNLINDVLDLNRIETGRIVLEKTDIPFKSLVENIIHENRPAAEQKQIQLSFEAKEGDYTLHIDGGKMERVVSELVSNAIKYTPEKGVVDVRLSHDDQHVSLSVKDSGIGMTPEECEKIWERFYRTNASKKFAKGSGLGLSIAKELVELHGGILILESEQGLGTKFTLQLMRKDS